MYCTFLSFFSWTDSLRHVRVYSRTVLSIRTSILREYEYGNIVASPRSMVRGVCSSAASRVDRRLTATQPHSTQRRGAQILAHIRSGEASLQIWPLPPANISSIASGNVTGAVTTSTFPTGNHVLHFFGMFDMDASRPWQEYHKRSDGFYDESDRDWFRLC
jgi:hypothetical protein